MYKWVFLSSVVCVCAMERNTPPTPSSAYWEDAPGGGMPELAPQLLASPIDDAVLQEVPTASCGEDRHAVARGPVPLQGLRGGPARQSLASFTNESTFSLANTLSSKSTGDGHTSVVVENDIVSTFLDLDRLVESEEGSPGPPPRTPRTPTSAYDAQFELSSLSSPTTYWDLAALADMGPPMAPPIGPSGSRISKRKSLPHLRTVRSHASLEGSLSLRECADGSAPSYVATMAAPTGMAAQAAKAAANSIPKRGTMATNDNLVAALSAAQAMYPLKLSSPKKKPSAKLRQKRNQTFQNWMTTFQKEDPKPTAAPHVHRHMHDGLMNFQVDMKGKK